MSARSRWRRTWHIAQLVATQFRMKPILPFLRVSAGRGGEIIMKMFNSTLFFLVLASGFAFADKPCYDTHGKIVQCPTVKPVAPVDATAHRHPNGADRVQQPAPATPTTPAPAPAPVGAISLNSSRSNREEKPTTPAPTPPAPAGATTVKGSKSNSSDRAQNPTSAPAPVGAISLNSSRSNPVEKSIPATPTTPPATMKGDFSRGNSPDRVKEPAPTPAGSKDKTAPYRDPEDMTTH